MEHYFLFGAASVVALVLSGVAIRGVLRSELKKHRKQVLAQFQQVGVNLFNEMHAFFAKQEQERLAAEEQNDL